ncbi:uncharacterized protein At4g06598-like [Tasmannia lanceolata]|uniref:uncharacterized protein At4g06598-like n=1 Tax=Tasmannia lanceolata TaxID=3420 RepID=UPI004063A4FD
MDNFKGTTNFRNLPFTGKQSLLPPKSPFPSITPSYPDYGPSSSKGIPRTREGNRHHQRTSSESFLIDEQPSWLDELLNEPETPVRKGAHRRSSSDSFAYLEASNNSSGIDNLAQNEYKSRNITSVPSWGSLDFDNFKDVHRTEANSFRRQPNRGWDTSLNSIAFPSSHSHPSARDSIILRSSGSSRDPREPEGMASTTNEKQGQEEFSRHDLSGSSERKDSLYSKSSPSEMDPKRAKQQFAQRSRVRKLQYIAELERNVQALQVEGSEVSAELEFLDQQNLILSMENNALKQRLDSLAQEQLIKYYEQEMLEREIARLRTLLYQQNQNQHQQQPPPPPRTSSHHRRSTSKDLDSQFSSLSLSHKEPNSSRESVSGPLQI